MADLQLMLTAEECTFLGSLLESALKEKRVEEHRTRSPSYRENVLQEESLITNLLGKLGRPCAV